MALLLITETLKFETYLITNVFLAKIEFFLSELFEFSSQTKQCKFDNKFVIERNSSNKFQF